tara:strand:+ start:1764 stop:2069 length:306 start_codon:yes stop_codon:yes gene_type:complete
MNASKALPFATPMLLATILMEAMTAVVMMDLKAMDTIAPVRPVHLSDEIMTKILLSSREESPLWKNEITQDFCISISHNYQFQKIGKIGIFMRYEWFKALL